MSEFLTIGSGIGNEVDVELEVKRSRFLTRLRRVTSGETACAAIEERRSRFFDARHHYSAFVLGPGARTARSSDDEEPAGTAGVPMLNVLTSNHLTDVVTVVTRYFGGVKLGASGLVRACSEVVAQAAAATGTRRMELRSLPGIDVDFASIDAAEDSLRGLILPSGTAVAVVGVDWGDRARITVAVPVAVTGKFDAFLAALSAGALTAVPAGQRWIDRPGG